MRFILGLVASALAISGSLSFRIAKQDHTAEIQHARACFTSRLLLHLDSNSAGRNVLVSPYSLHTLFSTVMVGSKDKTFNELWKGLCYEYTTLDQNSVLDAYQETFENLTELADYGLDFANLLGLENTVPLNQSYRDDIGRAFGTGLVYEDFLKQPAKSEREMNDWVKLVANKQLTTLFDYQFSGWEGAILMSALRLNSNWNSQFDPKKSYQGDFNLPTGKKTVTYMTIPHEQLKGSQYIRWFGYEIVRIPIDSAGRLYFSIILPNTVQPSFACCASVTDTILNAKPKAVDLTLPVFKLSQKFESIDMVRAMHSTGIHDVFDQAFANLSGIDTKHGDHLFVSNVEHKIEIGIDEKGVNGAYAAGLDILHIVDSTPARAKRSVDDAQEVVVDRPFVFIISDTNTNVDLFAGLVHEP